MIPQCTWYQRKTTVTISVRLPSSNDTQTVDNYELNITEKRFALSSGDKKVDFFFCHEIDPNSCKTKSSGPWAIMTFDKAVGACLFWDRITREKPVPSWMKVDWEHWVDEDDEKFDKEAKEDAEQRSRAEFNQRWMDSTVSKLENNTLPTRPEWRRVHEDEQKKKDADNARRISRLHRVYEVMNWLGAVGFHGFVAASGIIGPLMLVFTQAPVELVVRVSILLGCPAVMIDLLMSWQRLTVHHHEPLWRALILLLQRAMGAYLLLGAANLTGKPNNRGGVYDASILWTVLIIFWVAWWVRSLPSHVAGFLAGLSDMPWYREKPESALLEEAGKRLALEEVSLEKARLSNVPMSEKLAHISEAFASQKQQPSQREVRQRVKTERELHEETADLKKIEALWVEESAILRASMKGSQPFGGIRAFADELYWWGFARTLLAETLLDSIAVLFLLSTPQGAAFAFSKPRWMFGLLALVKVFSVWVLHCRRVLATKVRRAIVKVREPIPPNQVIRFWQSREAQRSRMGYGTDEELLNAAKKELNLIKTTMGN